ncbi:MAG: SsrA-binding protein SmpB [Anaerolineae bacterium]
MAEPAARPVGGGRAARPPKKDGGVKVVATNRRARHDFEITRTIEAGIALTGSEIKSVRGGRVSLQEAYVAVDRGEAWLVGANIASWQAASYSDHDPLRRRKLLLKAKEIFELGRTVQLKGMTLVPMRLYLKGGWAKLEVGVGRGKKLYDKRDSMKARDAARDVARATARTDR